MENFRMKRSEGRSLKGCRFKTSIFLIVFSFYLFMFVVFSSLLVMWATFYVVRGLNEIEEKRKINFDMVRGNVVEKLTSLQSFPHLLESAFEGKFLGNDTEFMTAVRFLNSFVDVAVDLFKTQDFSLHVGFEPSTNKYLSIMKYDEKRTLIAHYMEEDLLKTVKRYRVNADGDIQLLGNYSYNPKVGQRSIIYKFFNNSKYTTPYFHRKHMLINYIVPIFDGNQFIGYSRFDLSIRRFAKLLNLGKNSFNFILDRKTKNFLVSSDDKISFFKTVNNSKQFISPGNVESKIVRKGHKYFQSRFGKEYEDMEVGKIYEKYIDWDLYRFELYENEELEWIIVHNLGIFHFFQEIFVMMLISTIMSVLVMLILSLLSILLITFLIVHVRALLKNMKNAESMQLENYQRKISCFIEIAKIQRSFYYLLDRLIEFKRFLPHHFKSNQSTPKYDKNKRRSSISILFPNENSDDEISDDFSSPTESNVHLQLCYERVDITVVKISFKWHDFKSLGNEFLNVYEYLLDTIEDKVIMYKGIIITFSESGVFVGFQSKCPLGSRIKRSSHARNAADFSLSLMSSVNSKNSPCSNGILCINIFFRTTDGILSNFGSSMNRSTSVLFEEKFCTRFVESDSMKIVTDHSTVKTLPRGYVSVPYDVQILLNCEDSKYLLLFEVIDFIKEPTDKEWLYVYGRDMKIKEKSKDKLDIERIIGGGELEEKTDNVVIRKVNELMKNEGLKFDEIVDMYISRCSKVSFLKKVSNISLFDI